MRGIMDMDSTARTRSFNRGAGAAVAVAALAIALTAPVRTAARGTQAPQGGAAAPAFEVASIKPNNSGDGRVMLGNQPGRFTATNVTLRMLIRNAYQLQ